MRFVNFLNEASVNVEEIIDEIKAASQPFLKENKNQFLYSGRKSNIPFIRKKIRKDRRPLDTQEFIQDYINSIFKEKFGINLRSESMFCKSSAFVTSYGNAYYVFPIGKYDLYSSTQIGDLYMHLKELLSRELDGNPWYIEIFGDDWKKNKINHVWIWKEKRFGKYDNWPDNKLKKHLEEENMDRKFEDFTKITKEDVFDVIDMLNIKNKYKKNKSVYETKTAGEIMLHCKEVYLLDVDIIDVDILKEQLWK